MTSVAAGPGGMPPLVREMSEMMYGLVRTQALRVAASLGLADHLAAGRLSGDDLAALTKADPSYLKRVLRFLVSDGLLEKGADGRFALTPRGQLLRSDAPVSAKYGGMFYGSPAVWAAWGKLLDAVLNGTPAFELAHGKPVFEYLSDEPNDLRLFTDFMTEISRPRLAAAASLYDFPDEGLVVDVGGGEGQMLAAVLESRPRLKGLLMDLPEVIATAGATLGGVGIAERCDAIAGDFFEAVPEGGDIYLLSNIIHDWDDERCLVILRNCRRAMRSGTRLVLIDAVMPEENAPFVLAALDLQMLVVTGGQQRTEGEYRALLEPCGFRVLRVAAAGMIEAEAV